MLSEDNETVNAVNIRVISMNVMYSGRTDPEREDKIVALLSSKSDASTVILLQEVYNHLLIRLMERFKHTHLTSELYRENIRRCGYGVMVLIPRGMRVNWGYRQYSHTFMDRGLAVAELPDLGITFASTHLESMQTAQFDKIRAAQLAEMYTWLGDRRFVVGMDSNTIRDVSRSGVVDAWSDDPVPTWHGDRFFDRPVEKRYDRILLHRVAPVEKSITLTPDLSDHDMLECSISR